MILAQLYSIIYIVLHLGLVYRNWNLITGNGKSGFNLMNIVNRLWLLLLDLFVLELLPFQNDLWFFNIYPITIVFGVFFYYVIRYCLRKQYFFQYLTHLYHPQKHIYYLGHYYIGLSYSIADFAVKAVICFIVLRFHILLAAVFLLFTNLMDTYSYYKGITDNTSEIFHKIVGFLFCHIHNK